MQTNPESAAIEAVAWLVTSDDARVMCYAEGTAQAQAFELRKGGYPARIDPLYPQSALDALRGEVECLRVDLAGSHERAMMVLRAKDDWMKRANAAERRVAECLKFIDGIREELHSRRVADWYPEAAHNAAEQMSEDMRLIGNACANFDPAALTKESP